MNIGVSPITHTIYAGKIKPLANGTGAHWVGKKEDVTDEAIRAVFEYMYYKSANTGGYEIRFGDGKLGVMKFERTEDKG